MFGKRLPGDIDVVTIGLVLILTLFGAIAIASAAQFMPGHYVLRQVAWIVVGLAAMLLAMAVDYKILVTYALSLYVGLLAVLTALLVFARLVAGTKSWITLGGFRGQPSELGKIILILVLARFFSEHRSKTLSTRETLLSLGLAGPPILLIALQPDLGTALTCAPIVIGAFILAGLRRRAVVIFLVASLALGIGSWNFALKDYQKKRLTTLFNPGQDVRGAGYQILQSKIAIGSGGLAGKGFKKGSQSQLRFLPARHTDFIFSVVGEEFGFAGVFAVLAVYFLLFARLFLAVAHARDRAGVYIVFLAALLLAFQFFINILMIIGLFPVTGVPLPFVSYGGSSLLSSFIAVGLVLNVKMRRFANV